MNLFNNVSKFLKTQSGRKIIPGRLSCEFGSRYSYGPPGVNGAGKSTTIRMVNTHCDSGMAPVDDRLIVFDKVEQAIEA